MTHGRADVEAHLGYALPDMVWAILVDQGYEEDLDLELATPASVADVVRSFGPPPGRRLLSVVGQPELIPGAQQLRARSRALGAWLAAAAGDDPSVQAFRHDHLDGGLLPETEIGSWIADQDRRDRSPAWPVSIELSTEENATYRATADAQLAGVAWVSFTWMERSGDGWRGGRWPVPVGSVLASLAELAGQLHHKWRWREHEAVVFVLSGTQPDVRPIDGSSSIRRNLDATIGSHDITSRITVTVDPVVTPDQLAGWWRGARRQVLARRYRPMSAKHLELARFAANRPEAGTWDADRRAWNRAVTEAHPEWRYEDRRNFRRDALAAVRRLVFVGFRPN